MSCGNPDSILSWLARESVTGTGTVVWGLDIGGAQLKAVAFDAPTNQLRSRSLAFPLWKTPHELAAALGQLTSELPPSRLIAVTMTGEIADGFPDKKQGVCEIARACQDAFGAAQQLFFYGWSDPVEGGQSNGSDQEVNSQPKAGYHWVTYDSVERSTQSLAASNWHAVASLWSKFVGRMTQARGLILDLGSTTLDLTLVTPGQHVPGRTDWQRMREGELIYTGLRRSPLTCILPRFQWLEWTLAPAQELFATIDDAYIYSGERPERPWDSATADGRPATRAAAQRRLARLFCSDPEELPAGLLEDLAVRAVTAHGQLILEAMQRQLTRYPDVEWLLLMGEGEERLQQLLSGIELGCSNRDRTRPARPRHVWLGRQSLSPEISAVMPAFSVAGLCSLARTPLPIESRTASGCPTSRGDSRWPSL